MIYCGPTHTHTYLKYLVQYTSLADLVNLLLRYVHVFIIVALISTVNVGPYMLTMTMLTSIGTARIFLGGRYLVRKYLTN